MKPSPYETGAWRRMFAALLLLAASLQMLRADPTVVQELTLVPGWNAVHVDVQPEVPAIEALVVGLDVDSIWTYSDTTGSPEFVQDVTEEGLQRAGWFSWVSTNRVEAFQNDLLRLQANRAYLIRLNASTNQVLRITGRPSSRPRSWTPDTLNLRGLPVDPGLPPTFLSFFRASAAHFSPGQGLVPIYRLGTNGVWAGVQPSDLVESGKAYWIHCRGGSDYLAPVAAKPFASDSLEFGTIGTELEFELANLDSSTRTLEIRDLRNPGTNALSIAVVTETGGPAWIPLPALWTRTLPGRTSSRERIAIRRQDMTADTYETVLEVVDGQGVRLLIPLVADRELSNTGSSSSGLAKSIGSRIASGLWLGLASINAVSEAHSGPLATNVSTGFTLELETNATTGIVVTNRVPNSVVRTAPSMAPTPTASEFNLPVILHVDATGTVRLLKEVIEMWRDGTTTNTPDGTTVVVVPGREVLVTDETKITGLTGILSRDGTPVGRRHSTAGFDFAENELPMAGSLAPGGTVTTTNTLSETFARNPFRHRYHPAHRRGLTIRRVLRLEVDPASTNSPPGYGDSLLVGTYRETVTGLHKTNIVASGPFRLTRVSTTAVLNQ